MVTIQDARGGSVLIKKSDMALFFLLWLENLNVKEEEGGVGTWLTDMGKTHYLRFQRRHFTGLRGCHSSQPIYLDFFFVLFHTQYLHTAPISSLGGGGVSSPWEESVGYERKKGSVGLARLMVLSDNYPNTSRNRKRRKRGWSMAEAWGGRLLSAEEED